MKIKYFATLFAFVLLLLQLSSCIDIERNIKINADGSGTESQMINIDKSFYDMMIMLVTSVDSVKGKSIRDSLYNHDDFIKKILSDFDSTKDNTLKKVEGVTNADSSSTYTIVYDFDKIESLGRMTSPNPEQLAGNSKAEVKWTDKGNEILFTLKYNNASENEGENQGKEMANLFEGKQMKINIEFPYEIISTNAGKYSGKNASWVIGMKDMSMDPAVLYLEARLKK